MDAKPGMEYEEIRRFVEEHNGEDAAKLRLKYHGDQRSWIPLAINNVAALKGKKKFMLGDGADLTPDIIPLEVSAQQSTSAKIAFLHSQLAGDAKFILDMTFGLGMDARLMASDPRRQILGFDLRPELAQAAAYNFRAFPNVEVREGDSVEFLRNYREAPFELIFIDPARRGDAGQRLFNLHDCQPDLIELLPLIRQQSHRLMAKLSPMLDVTQTIRDLPGVKELHIVEENGECKELLAIVDFTNDRLPDEEPLIVVDRITPSGDQRFAFRQSEERKAASGSEEGALTGASGQNLISDKMPQRGDLLYEPSAATMKAAPFGLLTKKFGCRALAANSHIYISKEKIADFPGIGYMIAEAYPLTSSNIKKIARTIKQADVAVRNLKGFTADGLAKKMRIKPGGSLRILGTTVDTSAGSQPILLVLSKLSV